MEKRRLFRIMVGAKKEKLQALSQLVQDSGDVLIIKEPSKTLTMIKMREPVRNSLFYIGEVMVTETIVEMNKVKGMAVTMGDDFEKVLAMAVIDCGFNNHLPVMKKIEEELLALEAEQIAKHEQENAMYLKTMVNFNTMSGGEA